MLEPTQPNHIVIGLEIFEASEQWHLQTLLFIVWQMSWICNRIRFPPSYQPIYSICATFTVHPFSASFAREEQAAVLLGCSFNYTLTEGKNVNKTQQKETNDKKDKKQQQQQKRNTRVLLFNFMERAYFLVFSHFVFALFALFAYLFVCVCVYLRKGIQVVSYNWSERKKPQCITQCYTLDVAKSKGRNWSIPTNIWVQDTQ